MITNSSLFLSASNSSVFVCLFSTEGFVAFSTLATTNILLLFPLSVLVLYIGFQRWRRQRATSATTSTSHIDHFTYHMLMMEVVGVIGYGCYCIGNYKQYESLMIVGIYAFSIILPGQSLFHSLTCVERYLAVVHPITYLNLRNSGRNRIRDISIGCVWLVCVGWMGVAHTYFPHIPVSPLLLLFIVCFFVSSFCSVSALCTLTRPVPGDGVGDRDRVGLSKQRAFLTLVVIMGALVLRFVGLLVSMIMYRISQGAGGESCVVLKFSFWLCLPSSLVLPLLFLQKTGKLVCFKHNAESS